MKPENRQVHVDALDNMKKTFAASSGKAINASLSWNNTPFMRYSTTTAPSMTYTAANLGLAGNA